MYIQSLHVHVSGDVLYMYIQSLHVHVSGDVHVFTMLFRGVDGDQYDTNVIQALTGWFGEDVSLRLVVIIVKECL